MWRLRQCGHSSPGDYLLTAIPTKKSAVMLAGSPRAARQQCRGQRPALIPATDVTFAGQRRDRPGLRLTTAEGRGMPGTDISSATRTWLDRPEMPVLGVPRS